MPPTSLERDPSPPETRGLSRRAFVGGAVASMLLLSKGGVEIAANEAPKSPEAPSMDTRRYVGDLCVHPETVPWLQDELPDDERAYYDSLPPHRYHADKAGLTSLEVDDVLFSLEHVTSVQDILAAFNSFTREFGAGTTMAANWRPEGDAEAGTKLLADRMKSLVETMAVIPKELLELASIKSVHLTEMMSPLETSDGKVVSTAAGQAYIDEGRIELSPDRLMTDVNYVKTVLHEIGHVLDGALCGGLTAAANDTAFLALNRPPFAYDYDRAVQSIVAEGEDTRDVFGVARTYGLRNALEDKATLFEEMLAGVNFDLANSTDMILRDKYHFLLARLEEATPGIAAYLVAIGLLRPSASTKA